MNTRRQVALLAIAAGVGLAAGLPLLGLADGSGTMRAEGDVISVDLGAQSLRLHDTGAGDALRGQDATIRLPVGRIAVEPGHRPLGSLRPGDHVRMIIGSRSHWAHEITVDP
ncbi:hypothetical protein ABT369_46525 [Dactylosporangium sp. NPDC000244]|uniref:hypothetical protein n=1 Tax=Dactylosporangium sp. NPDC000244 TaxID=3154365 RepID=UPI00332A2856